MPFRRFVGYWTCVVVGRWIGGALGYRPFFKEYTTDWDYAVAKLSGSWLQRRLLHTSYQSKTPWPKQVELSSGPDPANAEYQEWLTDLAERASGNNKIETAGVMPRDSVWSDGSHTDHTNGIVSGVMDMKKRA
jgi:hypothetical protein